MIGPILIAIVLAQAAPSAPQTPAQQAPAATQAPAAEQSWPPAGAFPIGTGVTSPEVLKEEKPKYTAEAIRARLQGTVEVQAVVLPDGTVGRVRVVRSLDKESGLDDQAVAAVKNWRFNPGKKDGVAVPVIVSIELTFTLRAGPSKR